jgi:uncharacterized membrane protein SirB2
MTLQTTGISLLLIGAIFLLSPMPSWITHVAGMTFIAGFLVFGLDFMRRQITKDD